MLPALQMLRDELNKTAVLSSTFKGWILAQVQQVAYEAYENGMKVGRAEPKIGDTEIEKDGTYAAYKHRDGHLVLGKLTRLPDKSWGISAAELARLDLLEEE